MTTITAFDSPRAVSTAIRERLPTTEQESFWVIPCDGKMQGEPVMVALGTAGHVSVHPRDIFREAIRRNATGIVIAHNHPSGDPTPSAEDIAITEMIRAGAELLGLQLFDHVIVTDGGGFASFAELGRL